MTHSKYANRLQRLFPLLLALAVIVCLFSTVFAAVEDTGFSDVSKDAWYADAAAYCRDNGLMNGTSATTFAPEDAMTRAMLATVLYQVADKPAVSGSDAFSDTTDGAWYSDAVLWASQQGLVSGYGDGLFGTDDPVTREQIATILWHYEESPAADAGANFADESAISSWASAAVDWARGAGIINGKEGNRFDPAGSAARAEVASILMNYMRISPNPSPAPSPDPSPAPAEGRRVLTVYFSATGNTESVANHLEEALSADLYEITPTEPYTAEDLNYNNSQSRSQTELRDASARPAISGSVENMEEYDVIFLGYPIWNGQAPRIISTFLESYDFSGKTMIPFCTSGSSGIGSSASDLHSLASDAQWLSGQRFGGNTSQAAVESWIDSLNLELE